MILHLAHSAPMCFAVSKGWLPSDVQSSVWYYAFVAPTAEAMKGVTIQSLERRHWSLKSLKTKAPLHILQAMGRSVVNPCSGCWFADATGVGEYCGRCRSRPTVMRTRFCYLGDCHSLCRDASPRRTYLKALQRVTCPQCEHIYRHEWQVADFIEEEGSCPKCFHQAGAPP